MTANQQSERVRRLRGIATLLDESIPLPGGYRIGIDPIIGLAPGLGDAISAAFALFIILEARGAGASISVILRMLGNVLIDAVAGSVPIIGDLFDAAYKANKRNIDLLDDFLANPSSVQRASDNRVLAVSLFALLALLAIVALPIIAIVAIVRML